MSERTDLYDHKTEIIEMLTGFIRIPSVNPGEGSIDNYIYGENRYIEYVSVLLKNKGYFCTEQEVLPGRSNLVISKNKSLGEKPIVLFQTHSDVVDVQEMKNAFIPGLMEGRITGRGSCDAKGQLCTMIMAMELLGDQINNLPFDICISLCCDEEFKHRGVDEFLNWKYKEKVVLAIVGEPTGLRFASACKGSIRFCIETKGLAAHTSTPEKGENAIYLMAKIVQLLHQKAEKITMCKKDSRCGNATLSVSIINGGTIVNSVPDRCVIHVDRRMIPGENWKEVYQEIQDIIYSEIEEEEKLRIKFNVPYLIDPSYSSDISEKLECFINDVSVKYRLEEGIAGLSYGCDASKLAKWGVPVLVFGPGSIEQAHTNEEYIELNQIVKAVNILKDLILGLAEGDKEIGNIGNNY